MCLQNSKPASSVQDLMKEKDCMQIDWKLWPPEAVEWTHSREHNSIFLVGCSSWSKLTICKYVHICKYASMLIYESMLIYASMLVCNYASCSYMQVMQVYASMQVCKYVIMQVCKLLGKRMSCKIFARCSMFAVRHFSTGISTKA